MYESQQHVDRVARAEMAPSAAWLQKAASHVLTDSIVATVVQQINTNATYAVPLESFLLYNSYVAWLKIATCDNR